MKTRLVWVQRIRSYCLAILPTLIAILGLAASSAHAQEVTCLPIQQDLVKIPEIVTDGQGHLRGTIQLGDQQERIAFRIPLGAGNVPGGPGTKIVCLPQFVRAYQVGGTPPAPSGSLADPLPGPTLRARLGDIVELTFLNQINPADFGNSIDQDLVTGGTGCDQVSGIYPPTVTQNGKTTPADTFPNCFHGSSTANIHYHGTHTNPDTTGDNVLVQVRPSNPQQDGADAITAATYEKPFGDFFTKCETMLKGNPLLEWPKVWADLPKAYTDDQQARLIKYDTASHQDLWGLDQKAIMAGVWPDYYMGAVPYCYQLPKYIAATYPPPGGNTALQMGQSPGTDWYHAHKHGSTAIDVSNGMSGVFIIEGEYDDALNAYYNAIPQWTRTQPVILVNQIGVSPNLEHPGNGQTDKGPDFSVNGRLQPTIRMYPGEVQMWRIVNSSSRSAMYLPSLPPGFTWHQLAQDGVQFAPDNYAKTGGAPVDIASGNRVDLLVKAPLTSGQLPVQVMPNVASAEINIVPDATARGWPKTQPPPVTLLWVDVSGQGPEMQLIPKEKLAPLPPYLTDITDKEVAGHTRTITFASGGPGSKGQHTINGHQFSETDKQEWVTVDKLNTAEEWTIVNQTSFQPIDHPFHIHINPFQITEVFDPNEVIPSPGGPVYKYIFDPGVKLLPGQCYVNPNDPKSWKPCDNAPSSQLIWWDTFPIPSGRTATGFLGPDGKTIVVAGHFKMRTRFVDFPGVFVMHCHILAHEDRGMMNVVAVAVTQAELANVHHH
jgi:FtsP/CotA-like multicopper oxidase with cupredoxin domain